MSREQPENSPEKSLSQAFPPRISKRISLCIAPFQLKSQVIKTAFQDSLADISYSSVQVSFL